MFTYDHWVYRAIAECGSQKELSRLMGEKPEKVSYLLNRAKKINLEDALKIEAATGGIVTRYHLAGRLNIKVKRLLEEKPKAVDELRISERVGIGVAHEREIGPRRGARSDLLRENFPKVSGRTEALAAIYAGFRNYKTYHQAKLVTEYGIPELIDAMDSKHIAISMVAKLARLSKEEQHKILRLSKKEIITQIKRSSQTNDNTLTILSKENLDTFFLNFLKIYFLLMRYIERNEAT
jgi:DNA-binding transcriptional regulator YdaS (Cro superfamily)